MNILETALSFVDKSRADLSLNKSLDWCAETVMEILNRADIPDGAKEIGTISCTQTLKRAEHNDYWYFPEDDMKPADIISYNWGHDYDPTGNQDHTGIIVEVHTDYIVVVEGNTEGREMSAKVRKVKRLRSSLNFNCQYPDYYIRLKPNTTITPTTELTFDKSKLKAYVEQLRTIANDLEKMC